MGWEAPPIPPPPPPPPMFLTCSLLIKLLSHVPVYIRESPSRTFDSFCLTSSRLERIKSLLIILMTIEYRFARKKNAQWKTGLTKWFSSINEEDYGVVEAFSRLASRTQQRTRKNKIINFKTWCYFFKHSPSGYNEWFFHYKLPDIRLFREDRGMGDAPSPQCFSEWVFRYVQIRWKIAGETGRASLT